MLSSFTTESCPKKEENILQLRRKQMIVEHRRFFSQNTCAMLESNLDCKQQHLSIRNSSILNVHVV